MLYMFFYYGCELFPIQQIFICFESILKNITYLWFLDLISCRKPRLSFCFYLSCVLLMKNQTIQTNDFFSYSPACLYLNSIIFSSFSIHMFKCLNKILETKIFYINVNGSIGLNCSNLKKNSNLLFHLTA